MRVFITSPTNPNEWCVIELQGALELGPDINGLAGLDLGNWTEQLDGKVILIIGKHELEGKLTTLEKPLMVMEKKENPADLGDKGDGEYQVVGIVRKKYLFKNRPKPILFKK